MSQMDLFGKVIPPVAEKPAPAPEPPPQQEAKVERGDDPHNPFDLQLDMGPVQAVLDARRDPFAEAMKAMHRTDEAQVDEAVYEREQQGVWIDEE